MAELIKVELKRLFKKDNAGGGVFLGNDDKTFAIFIGPGELNALILAGGGIPVPRPLTHNLIDMVLAGFDIEVRSIVINDLVDDAYRALLTLAQGNHEVVIDCRPSDALILAVMRKKEVYVTRELFERVEDGDALLEAMREEIQRVKPEGPDTARGGKRRPKKATPAKEAASEEVNPSGEKSPSPEGGLGDVRTIEGIDWSSLESK